MKLQEAGLRYSIDIYRLEEEWRGHSQMVANAVEIAADCQRVYDTAKDALEYNAAYISNAVRSDPVKYLPGKVTEDAIKDCVRTHPDYRLASKVLVDARHAMNLADGAVLSLEHKKRALTKLCDLWEKDYYSGATSRVDETKAERFARIQQRKLEEQTEDDGNGTD